MRYINKYNNFDPINESLERDLDEFVSDLFDILMDLHDSGKNVNVESSSYGFRLVDYLEGEEIKKNDILSKFKPIYKSGNKIKSSFNIKVLIGELDYKKVNEVTNDMLVVNNRLSEMGWEMTNYEVEKHSYGLKKGEKVNICLLHEFRKPTVTADDEITTIQDENEIASVLYKIGNLHLESFTKRENIIYVGASSPFTMDDKIEVTEEQLDKMCDVLGFSSYDYDLRENDTWIIIKFFIPDAV